MVPGDTEILDGLTEAQCAAVSSIDGPLLVLAGPGSGKTTVVTRRVAYLVSQGIPAWQILCLTFTNKAAGEMRERIDRLVPADVPGRRGLTMTTFHAFCARMLRRYAAEANLSEQYTIYDSADQRDAMKRAMKTADVSTRNFTPGALASTISNAKNRLLTADAFAAEAGDFYGRTVARVYHEYERLLRQNNAVDFDDLLLMTARLFRDNEMVREELQSRYQYLLIDEYQDTNHAQFLIAGTLAASHRNICVVGDPDQSIYGWRGADIGNILEFEAQYPEATIVPLGENFRSTELIVRTADALIKHNRMRKDKTLSTSLGEGEAPQVVIARDERHEASMIVDECRRRHDDDGVPWKEMAVLYRVNALSRVLEEAFRNGHVPYVIARGTAFYDRKEVKDALAYLRLLANPVDEVSLRRIVNTPPRGIGKTTLTKIELYAINRQVRLLDAMREVTQVEGLTPRAVKSVAKFVGQVDAWLTLIGDRESVETLMPGTPATLKEIVEVVVRESGLEQQYRGSGQPEDLERLENLAELVSAAAQFMAPETGPDDALPTPSGTLRAYLESVALVSDADMVDPANGAVTLMTLHAAKGLEFDMVALAGLEEGLLPHSRAAESDAELEEERRLCFVGITRARRHLTLSSAAIRTTRGIRERTIRSQFLRELPEDIVEFSDQAVFGGPDAAGDFGGDDYNYDQTTGYDDDDAGITVGCVVRHPKFGVGRVASVIQRRIGASARIDFERVGSKTLMLEYARLERVVDL